MKIAVDAGHGSYTAGKRTPPMPHDISFKRNGVVDIKKGERLKEHIANVGVANYLVNELKRNEFDVVITGFDDNNAYDDPDTALSTRQKKIKKANCDYSVSIHFNAYGDGDSFNSAEGVSVYIHSRNPNKSKSLAKTVLSYLTKGTSQKNRGVRTAALAMCNCNSLGTKGSILVETAFMTNRHEATELMGKDEFWKEAAKEICQGICKHVGKKYIEEIYVPKKSVTRKSSERDVKWLQEKLNTVLDNSESYQPLVIDGIYGNKTRISVLIYWEQLGWNDDGADTGWRAGKATRKALAAGRKR